MLHAINHMKGSSHIKLCEVVAPYVAHCLRVLNGCIYVRSYSPSSWTNDHALTLHHQAPFGGRFAATAVDSSTTSPSTILKHRPAFSLLVACNGHERRALRRFSYRLKVACSRRLEVTFSPRVMIRSARRLRAPKWTPRAP